MTDSDSRVVARVVAGLLALPLAGYALLAFGSQLRTGFDPLATGMGACPAALAFLGGWFALRGHEAASRARMQVAVLGGLLVGTIGFLAGFFGPIFLTPEANQGPLLGIFYTGPLGFAVGTAGGWAFARMRSSR